MKTKKHSTRKHALYSPSSAKRWMNCHGSINLIKLALKECKIVHQDSPAAVEGTRAHECLEFIVKRYDRLIEAKQQALKKWDKEMVEHAVNSARTIFKLRPSKTAKLLIESKTLIPGTDCYGTLDYAWVDQWGELIVLDYKYGSGVPVLPIDEETKLYNEQIMLYALGIAHKYKFEFERVKIGIIQPRVWREDENPLSLVSLPVKELKLFEKRVRQAIIETKKEDAELKPSEDNCRWCPVVSLCPAVSTLQMDKAGIAFTIEKGVEKLPEIHSLNSKTLPQVLDACDLLENWIEQVRAHAFVMACDGEKIEGRKLVLKRSVRSWLPEALKAAEKTFGKEAFETKLLSPAQIEKTFGKNAKDFTEKYSSNVSSGVTLVKQSDKRKEVENLNAFAIDSDDGLRDEIFD